MNRMMRRLLARGGYMAPESGGEAAGAGGGDAAAAEAAALAVKTAADAAAALAAKAAGTGPTDAEAALLKENMKKKGEIQRLSDELAAAKTAAQRFDGIDPDAVRKLLADQKATEVAALEAKGDFDRLKTMMAADHTVQMTGLQSQIDTLTAQLAQKDGVVNELSVGQQFSQSKFITEELILTPSKARVIYGEHFDVVDGKVIPFDKPRGHTARTALVDASGTALSFEGALKHIVDADPDKDHLMRSKVKQGAGSGTQKPPAGGVGGAKPQGPTNGVDLISAGLKSMNFKI